MDKRERETLSVRILSVAFACLAFAIFKPIDMGRLGAMLYLHLLVIFILGISICYVTETIVKYLINMPATFDRGVDYIIKRNLWFQIINIPLESLLVCCYLHFPMRSINANDPLSWRGYIHVLVILAFCSFAIGLYWRFKYRSRYLSAELEELKVINKALRSNYQINNAIEDSITLTGSTSETVSFRVSDLLYIEAVGNYVKVYQWRDERLLSDMLRATLKQVEEQLKPYPMIVRCHRAFLVHLSRVEKIVSRAGTTQLTLSHVEHSLPVSRSKMPEIKKTICSSGLRANGCG